MPGLDQCILDKCKQSWDEEFLPGATNKNNCSGFVKSVAKKLGAAIPETANADGIIDAVSKSWAKLESGAEAGRKAPPQAPLSLQGSRHQITRPRATTVTLR